MRSQRKDQHLQAFAALTERITSGSGLDDVRLVNRCLPELDLASIDLRTELVGMSLASPIIVNAMTGGSQRGDEINFLLATAAEAEGLAMAVGSQSVALAEPDARVSLRRLRAEHPRLDLFANVSATTSVTNALQAVDMIEARALQLHLNVIQEGVMQEGECQFSGVLDNIAQIVDNSPVPVIMKEVGFGICGEDAQRLSSVGVRAIDVGGSGGTDFAAIERYRRKDGYGGGFVGWGIPTVASVLECVYALNGKADVVGSGGVRNGVDVLKLLALGSKAAGVAGSFLAALLHEGVEGLRERMRQMNDELRLAMLSCGLASPSNSSKLDYVLVGDTLEWVRQRLQSH